MINYYNDMSIAQSPNLLGHEIKKFSSIYIFEVSWKASWKTLTKALHSAVFCRQKWVE